MYRLNQVVWGVVMGLGLGYQGIAGGAAEQSLPAGGQEMAAMMDKAKKYMTPGDQHRALDPLIGKWNAKTSSWMKPGDKPEVSEGTQENAWTLNNHHLQQKYSGTWGGQRFEGLGFIGFDMVRGEYQSVWLDSMGTGMMMVAGQFDTAAKTLHQGGSMSCPMTGEKNMWYRSELKIHSPSKHTYASYTKGPDGKEFKNMEIVYTRAN